MPDKFAYICPNPACRSQGEWDASQAGQPGQCTKCGTALRLTAAEGASQTRAEGGGDAKPKPKTAAKKLGRFELRARLGAGAFGTVFRAYDPRLERDVALKVLRASRMGSASTQQRFLREARAAARLTHPGIVPIFDTGEDGDQLYIASGYVDGQTLQDAIDAQGQVPRADYRSAATLVAKLADALAYAHRQGILHRDVKPANVMVDRSGEPHLLDFGLARLDSSEDKLTQDGSVLGTPAYMSPEQARGDQSGVGPASDQYSLGVVLYEMLVGRTPFSGTPAIVLFNIVNQAPEPPRKLASQVPRDLETICLKAMAREPVARYADCAELAADLRRWLDGQPIRARRLPALERVWLWCRREPWLAGALATVMLSLLIVAVVSQLAAGRLQIAASAERAAREEAQQSATTAASKAEDERKARAAAEAAQAAAEAAQKLADENRLKAVAEAARADEQRLRAEGLLEKTAFAEYAAKISLAQRRLESGDFERGWHALRSTPPPHRGWEYRHLLDYYHRSRRRLAFRATALAAHPTQDWLAFAMPRQEGTEIVLWDCYLDAPRQRFAFDSGDDSDECIEILFDGRGEVLVARSDHRIVAWNVDGRLLQEWDSVDTRVIALHPDGKTLLFANDRGLEFVELATKSVTRTWQDVVASSFQSYRFTPNGEYLLATGSLEIKDRRAFGVVGWKVNSNGSRVDLQLEGNSDEPHDLAVSADGTLVAAVTDQRVGRRYVGEICVWSLATKQLISRFATLPTSYHELAFLDGTQLAVGNDSGELRIHDASSGKVVSQARLASDRLYTLAPRAGGRELVCRTFDAMLCYRPLPLTVPLEASDSPGDVRVALSHDNQWLVSSTRDTLKLWNLATGESTQLNGDYEYTGSISLQPRGTQLAAAITTTPMPPQVELRVWDAAAPTAARVLWPDVGEVFALAYSPDGTLLAVSRADATSIVRTDNGQVVHTLGDMPRATRCDWSPDGQHLIVSRGEVSRLILAESCATVAELKGFTACFSPDGSTLSGFYRDHIEGVVLQEWRTDAKVSHRFHVPHGVGLRAGWKPTADWRPRWQRHALGCGNGPTGHALGAGGIRAIRSRRRHGLS